MGMFDVINRLIGTYALTAKVDHPTQPDRLVILLVQPTSDAPLSPA